MRGSAPLFSATMSMLDESTRGKDGWEIILNTGTRCANSFTCVDVFVHWFPQRTKTFEEASSTAAY